MTAFTHTILGTRPFIQNPTCDPKEVIKSEINRFAHQANDLANQILMQGTQERYSGPVIIRNDYYPLYYSPWHYMRPSVIVLGNDRNPGRDREKDNGVSLLLGILATVGALFASYAVGSAIAGHHDAKRELDDTRYYQKKFFDYQRSADQDLLLINEAVHAASLKERICSRIRNSKAIDLALRATLAAGLVLTAISAFTACPPLIGLGLGLIGVSASAILFKWGFESTDKANLRDAQSLKASLVQLGMS